MSSGLNVGDPITPRAIADDEIVEGGCFKALSGGPGVHYHVSAFLVVGDDRTVLVDTGDPGHWDAISADLDAILGERPLDYLFPTHPELPHAGNLPFLFDKYPGVQIVGDVRDYHVHYPQMEGSLVAFGPGDRLDLGGRELEFLPAIVLDLQNSLWALDSRTRTLFVSDGFSYIHELPEGFDLDGDEPPVHLAGQCESVSVVLDGGPTVDQAASTIVDCTGVQPRVLRVGAVPVEELRTVLADEVAVDDPTPPDAEPVETSDEEPPAGA